MNANTSILPRRQQGGHWNWRVQQLLLARLAKQGKRVVRLKGGDPFIFGRGGEEAEALVEAGLPFEVVPGITAASGCASYAGIPLTHRDYAQSVTFVTGHLKDNSMNLNWSQLAQPHQTVVFYMGLKGLPVIARELQAHGRAPDTPAALVQQGTTHKQRVFTGTLASLPDIVSRERPKPPTLIIVGKVVGLREKLELASVPDLVKGTVLTLMLAGFLFGYLTRYILVFNDAMQLGCIEGIASHPPAKLMRQPW